MISGHMAACSRSVQIKIFAKKHIDYNFISRDVQIKRVGRRRQAVLATGDGGTVDTESRRLSRDVFFLFNLTENKNFIVDVYKRIDMYIQTCYYKIASRGEGQWDIAIRKEATT